MYETYQTNKLALPFAITDLLLPTEGLRQVLLGIVAA
jgi:hypothetical protein